MKLFLSGDVMTGRGIDQILPSPCDPDIHEPYMRSSLDYVSLAERASGAIPKPVAFDYIWGDALAEIRRRKPDLRIVNLETSITADSLPEAKGINYRMNPANIGCLTAADIDCCVLANNHVADWGKQGLRDTIEALDVAGIAHTGAGIDADTAARPAILKTMAGTRVVVFGYASPSSGVPASWEAGRHRPGVNLLSDVSEATANRVAADIEAWRKAQDIVIVSIHWGPNWSYAIPEGHRRLARQLLENGQADVIHGHSSHHPLAIETFDGKPVFYGCGDFINDYEGIGGREEFRPELTLAYFLDFDERTHRLRSLEMVPFRLRRFRLEHTTAEDAAWMAEMLDRECRRFDHRVRMSESDALVFA